MEHVSKQVSVVALFLTLLSPPAHSDDFTEQVEKALTEFFEVKEPNKLATQLAADPAIRKGGTERHAARIFAELLQDKTPQKIVELGAESHDRLTKTLSDGEKAFFKHLELATSEALKIMDSSRTPADPRADDDATFKNDFFDAYSTRIATRLDAIKEARKAQLKRKATEDAEKGTRDSEPVRRQPQEGGAIPHRELSSKRRPPAPEETRASKEWARQKSGGPTARQIENWLIDLNTEGNTEESKKIRRDAAKLLIDAFADSKNSNDFVDQATSKDLSKQAQWERFGLKGSGVRALRLANESRNQQNITQLREDAYNSDNDNSGAARDELVHRVNADVNTDRVGAWTRTDFPTIRPELLLDYQDDIVEGDQPAANALARLIGTLNTHQLRDLASRPTNRGNGNEDAEKYAKRVACAANRALQLQNASVVNATACNDLGSFGNTFESALRQVYDHNRQYQQQVTNGRDPNQIQSVRQWLLDANGGGYTRENLMDRLAERVQTAQDARVPLAERQAAHDEAIVLARVLGHKDPQTGDWYLNIRARDAGFNASQENPEYQTLVLGKGDEIFGALARFGRRDTENHRVDTRTNFGNRSRFQSFTISDKPHSEHIATPGLRIYYAPGGNDKRNQLALGTVNNGRISTIGARATDRPEGIRPFSNQPPPEQPPPGQNLEAQVRRLISTGRCIACHEAKTFDNVRNFVRDNGLNGRMSGGPSISGALSREPQNLQIFERWAATLSR